MELLSTIHLALDLTERLHAALVNREPDCFGGLLEEREQAMAEFEKAHRAASDQDRHQCRLNVAALYKADQSLQEKSKEMLALVAAEFRGQLGLPLHPAGGDPQQACLDRKA